MALPTAIPRLIDSQRCRTDPLGFLRAARSISRNLVVISEQGSIFSRASECSGTVAAFGPEAVREVLSDIDLFGMPVSVAEKFSLPERLVRLNKGLFGMHGEEHRKHQQLLSPLLGANSAQGHATEIADGWEAFQESLRPGQETPLLEAMRRLVLHVTTKVLFGDGLELGRLIQSYFDQRRSLSGDSKRQTLDDRRKLIRTGISIERSLRKQLSRLRLAAKHPDRASCVLAELANSADRVSWQPSDNELVAHGNVLFMSGSEPIAVSLAWILLVLSQRPDLCLAARGELGATFGGREIPHSLSETELPFLHRIILETHRLLPPNAIMVRLTRKDGKVLGHHLPAKCEVVLCPFMAHRDAEQYADPDRFDPNRWIDFQPRPFAYFPFGMGGRYCLGKSLATATLLSILARILHRYEVVLARDVELDWKMDITLMPRSDPTVRFQPLTVELDSMVRGRLSGPVSKLVQL